VADYFDRMSSNVHDRVGNVNLPIVGANFDDLASLFLHDIGSDLTSSLTSLGQLTPQDIQSAIVSALGSDLGDWNGDSLITAADVNIVSTSSNVPRR
jgi:hypothetical protein